MSFMLEQAIIDAEALKEAALTNAEQSIIEKYAGEIKEAVESLLEQEDPSRTPDPSANLNTVSLDDTDSCPCPKEDEKEEIELTLRAPPDAGQEAGAEAVGAGAAEAGGALSPGGGPPPLGEQKVLDLNLLEEHVNNLEEEYFGSDGMSPEEGCEDHGEEPLEEEEEIDLNESDMEELLEELMMDQEITPRGSTSIGPPTPRQEKEAEEVALAKEKLEEAEEENEDLKEGLRLLKKKFNILVQKAKEQKEINNSLKEHLISVNVSNAKLLYTNKILSSTSLNERQKYKIVEAISKTETVKEAKVIFETLQNSVGGHQKKAPKSLNEAVARKPSLILSRRQEKQNPIDSVSDRWKKLAGIN